MEKYLQLTFTLTNGKSISYRVDHPQPQLTAAQINAAMDAIVAANVYERAGIMIAGKKSAQFVERSVTPVEIV